MLFTIIIIYKFSEIRRSSKLFYLFVSIEIAKEKIQNFAGDRKRLFLHKIRNFRGEWIAQKVTGNVWKSESSGAKWSEMNQWMMTDNGILNPSFILILIHSICF